MKRMLAQAAVARVDASKVPLRRRAPAPLRLSVHCSPTAYMSHEIALPAWVPSGTKMTGCLAPVAPAP